VRHGDWLSFPDHSPDRPEIDAVVAWSDAGRLSGVFVNTGARAHVLTAADWDPKLAQCREVLRLDTSTGERIVREPFNGTVRLDGYGIAVVSTAPSPALATARPALGD
jgi:hypothetical protein